MASHAQTFEQARSTFYDAHNHLVAARGMPISDHDRDTLNEAADDTLDALLAVPSAIPEQFGKKILALAAEYGDDDWQPRHMRALMADVKGLMPND